MSKQTTKLVDESQDQKYFTITPRLVWALSRTPYDYTLWSVIKGIAGDSGECYLTTDDLAVLSMMSTGQVSESRKYWQDTGLLFGDFRRDPGYPQPVWHMRIPNIWKSNIEWAEKYAGLKERVEFKRAQDFDLQAKRKQKRLELQEKKSLQQVEPSPGEEGVTPGEGGVTPGETKNINKEIKKDSVVAPAPTHTGMINPNSGNRTDAKVKGDPMDGILDAARQAAGISEIEKRILAFPVDCQSTLRTLVEFFRWQGSSIPENKGRGGTFGQWISEIRTINSQVGEFGQAGVKVACKASVDLTVSHPAAITWAIGGELGKLSIQQEKTPNVVDTPFAKALETPVSEETKKTLEDFGKVLRERNAAKKRQPA